MASEVYPYATNARVLTPYYCGGVMYVSLVLNLFKVMIIERSRELEDQGDSDSGSSRTVNLLWDAIKEMIGKEFDGRSFTVNGFVMLCFWCFKDFECEQEGWDWENEWRQKKLDLYEKKVELPEDVELAEMGLKAIENSRFSCKTRNWSSPHHCVSKKQMRECTLAALGSWLGTVHLDKTIKGIPFVIFNDKKSSMGCYRRMIRKELDECSFTVKEAKSRESDSVVQVSFA
ncbi:hypothetical protein ISN45_Aa08g009530 [Arabidopsis thaliana x Arabidopsis arenosa]|uniref:Uncharacterized protein n=1 Tax=Arabidopsis thaliana x Arabidopsis arenosa TaxID=1240361 RepID=A0A8T1XHN9_9BRAS|nr:hypothetical protein ISN45_Aa08g009530 [Arabidopsis thaliana x Arabidopsis arenosa]